MMLFILFVRQLDRPIEALKKMSRYKDVCLTSNIESNCFFIIKLMLVFACLTFVKHFDMGIVEEKYHDGKSNNP